MSSARMLSALVVVFAAKFIALEYSNAAEIDYQKQVRPVLAEHCWHCHGVDEKERKGGLRLDDQAAAFKGGESGSAAIIPGHPDKSELLARMLSHDADVVMPPPSQEKRPTEAEIAILRQWIQEGAKYEAHWAFTAPVRPAAPSVPEHNPIDAFVAARLQKEGLKFSPPASPEILCRRLYLDLIGVPPTPQQLQDFQQDGAEATIDKLLKDERYGEKWARLWLDLARYSDTNGYEKDLQREQWIWRDWVIEAYNQDMPYNQFLIEQIAGDLLPNATQKQMIATGFLRNSMINEEGAIVPEQFRMVEMFDRMDCLGKAVMGLTTQCAQCHSHKFDPLTHDEYYGMFAFLNDTYEAQSWVYTPEQEQQVRDIREKVAGLEERIRTERPAWAADIEAFSTATLAKTATWTPLDAIEMGSISGLNHPTQEADKSLLMKGHSSGDVFLIAAPKLDGISGLQLEILNHRDLPQNGPGRSRSGTWIVHELEVLLKKPDSANWDKVKLVNATADFSEAEAKSGDGKTVTGPVSLLIDGNDSTSWKADRGQGLRNQPSVAVMQFESPLNYPEGTQIKIAWRMGDMPGCVRFSLTHDATPAAPTVDHGAVLAIRTPAADRSAEKSTALFSAWRKSVPELKTVSEEIDGLWKSMPQAPTTVLHMAARESSNHRATSVLDRGNWDQPVRLVEPHVPAAFNPLPENAPKNRLGFAMWLTDPKAPLTARVAVNQTWQAVFGTGLVETPEDFGTRSAVPEYRDILDWLAAEFMDRGWSRKDMLRTIVRSQTYQQSSSVTPELLERDPRNVLLARGPRFRADAEVVRDIALSVAGMLSSKHGGPSVIPPVPQNVLDYNYVYPGYWTPATGEDRYRRAVYVFRKRSMPDPVLTTLDAPNGDAACARRVRSNTPLAALTGLNEMIFVEAARGLGMRILREGGTDDASRAAYGFLLCTSRQPTESELKEVLAALKSRRQRIADGWLNAREVTTGDPAKLPELPPDTTPQDAAAWTLLARVLLNLDETVTKN